MQTSPKFISAPAEIKMSRGRFERRGSLEQPQKLVKLEQHVPYDSDDEDDDDDIDFSRNAYREKQIREDMLSLVSDMSDFGSPQQQQQEMPPKILPQQQYSNRDDSIDFLPLQQYSNREHSMDMVYDPMSQSADLLNELEFGTKAKSSIFKTSNSISRQKKTKAEPKIKQIHGVTPAALQKGKLGLKQPKMAQKLPPTPPPPEKIEVKDLLGDQVDTSYLPLKAALDQVRILSNSGRNFTSLDLSGMGQLTDMFFYMYHHRNITLEHLSSLILRGCHKVTDDGMYWCSKSMTNLKQIDLSGCKKLTERTYHYFTSTSQDAARMAAVKQKRQISLPSLSLQQLHMIGTAVTAFPTEFDKVGHFEQKSFAGCPIISPPMLGEGKGNFSSYKGKVKDFQEFNIYKVVILKDSKQNLPSVASELTKQTKSGPGLNIWPKWNPAKGVKYAFNIYEIDVNSGIHESFLSNGSVVILPCTDDQSDKAVTSIALALLQIIGKCPEVAVVLAYKDELVGKQPSYSASATSLRSTSGSDDLLSKVLQKAKELEKSLVEDPMTEESKFDGNLEEYKFSEQEAYVKGGVLKRTLSTMESNHLLFSIIMDSQGKIADSQLQVLATAIDDLIKAYPWHGILYHKDTLGFITGIPSDLPSLCNIYALKEKVEAATKMKGQFGQQEVETIIQLAHTRGLCYSFPNVSGFPVCTNTTSVEQVFQSLVTSKSKKYTVQGLGPDFPCFTREDIVAAAKGNDSIEEALEDTNIVMKIPCKLEGGGSHAYVMMKDLLPPDTTLIDSVWAPDLTDKQLQCDKLYHTPTLGEFVFNKMIRKFSQISRFTLLWKRGFVIQMGPVTVLVEIHNWHEGVPGLYVAARIDKVKSSGDVKMSSLSLKRIVKTPEKTVTYETEEPSKILYSAFKNVTVLVDCVLQEEKQFYRKYLPSVTLSPGRNRRMLLKSNTKWISFIDTVARREFGSENQVCTLEGQQLQRKDYLGPDGLSPFAIPDHTRKVVLGVFNKCFMCNNCAEHGVVCENNFSTGLNSGQCGCPTVEFLCSHCGVCIHCIRHLARAYSEVYPALGSSLGEDYGKMAEDTERARKSLAPQEDGWTQTMSYIYFSHLEFTMTEGESLELEISGDEGKKTLNLNAEGIVYTRKDKAGQTQPHSSPPRVGDTWEIVLDVVGENDPTGNFRLELLKNSEVERFMALQYDEVKVTVSPKKTAGSFTVCSKHKMDMSKQDPSKKGTDTDRGTCCSHFPSEYQVKMAKSALQILDESENNAYKNNLLMACLPEAVDQSMCRYPSYQATGSKLLYHALCTPQTFSAYEPPTQPHLMNMAGLSIPPDLLDKSRLNSLLGCMMLLTISPVMKLPKYDKLFPHMPAMDVNTSWVEDGIKQLLQYQCMKLFVMTGSIMSGFTLDVQSFSLDGVKEDGNLDTLEHIRGKTSQNLCPGHTEVSREYQSLTHINVAPITEYSNFITKITLTNNHITELPAALFEATPLLSNLELGSNLIEVIPKSIGKCPQLMRIGLSYNNLKTLPDELTNLQKLIRLDLSGNLMTEIPACVCMLKSLERLLINNLLLQELPESISSLENLSSLYASGNCLTKLPKSFGNLKKLKELSLPGVNWYQGQRGKSLLSYADFEKFLFKENILPWLDAHNEDKAELFKEFDEDFNGVLDVKELSKLNASLYNIFPRFGYKGSEAPDDDSTPSGFPEVICQLKNLRYLNLDYQGIVYVPDSIKNLQNLEVLTITNNPHLLSLSAEVGLLPLKRLELNECPALKTPPKEILSRGFKAVMAYLRRLATGSVECKRTKLMLVGLGGAGKTSLCRTLMNGEVGKNLTGAEDITDGIDIANWTVSFNDNQIMYSVWDFAGQTVYYNTHQFFLSKRAVYLLLWNVRLGFEHAGLRFWLSSVSVHAPKAPILVVGTHVDQVTKAELPMEELTAMYPQIAGFYFISSYTGQGIDKLKSDLYSTTLDQDYMGEKIPLAWLDLEKAIIAARQKGNDVMDYSIIEKKAADCGIVDKTEVAQSLQFLHDLGAVQHFNNHYLKSRVVINPQWIVDVMACVVSVKQSVIQDGRLKHADLKVIWKDYPANMHEWLLRLTEEFDLTFPLEGEKVNLVPCLLPEKMPKLDWPEANRNEGILENKLIYRFDHLPAGLFNRAQVRLHQFSDSALIWKRGSFLRKTGHIALIQQVKDQEMTVHAQGPRPENMLFRVHEVFESLITEFFQGLQFDFQLPCPDCLKQGVKDPHMFYASTVRRAVEMKAPFLQCLKSFHTIMVTDMQASMPPDTNNDYDVHMAKTISGLQEVRKSMATDIFISYCEKDAPKDRSKVIHPATVKDDLENHGYTCFYPESTGKYSSDSLARSLIDSSVFVVFMSPNYAKEPQCCDIFQYAKLTLGKPIIVVAVGEDVSWQKEKIGIFLQDVVYVNMVNSKKPVYNDKLNELLQKLDGIANTAMISHDKPEVFVSYCWSNSLQACKKGTKQKEEAIGDGDPRELKEFIENEGKMKCWIDIERVGMTGLFEEIVKGLLQSRIMVACISHEYTGSQSCQKEFLYALNALKLPIVCAIVGKGDEWKYTSVGMMAFNLPQVNFQTKSEGAQDQLLKLIREKMLPEKKEESKKGVDKKEQNQLCFQELYELAQRKFLRQVAHYASNQDAGPYPRLFAVDIVKKEEMQEEEGKKQEGDKGVNENQKDVTEDEELEKEKDATQKERSRDFRDSDFCVYTLCEHEEGWHSVEEPFLLPDYFGQTMLDDFAPYLARMTAILKHNKDLVLHCLSDPVGKEYVRWLHEMSLVTHTDFQAVYQSFRQEIINLDENRKMGSLSRCRQPSGKTIWLCSKHCKETKVTILSDDVVNKDISGTQDGLDHMIEYLRTLDSQTLQKKFKSSNRTKRTIDILKKYDTSMEDKFDMRRNEEEEVIKAKRAAYKSRPSKLNPRMSTLSLMANINDEDDAKVSVQKSAPQAKDDKVAMAEQLESNAETKESSNKVAMAELLESKVETKESSNKVAGAEQNAAMQNNHSEVNDRNSRPTSSLSLYRQTSSIKPQPATNKKSSSKTCAMM